MWAGNSCRFGDTMETRGELRLPGTVARFLVATSYKSAKDWIHRSVKRTELDLLVVEKEIANREIARATLSSNATAY